MNYPFKIIESKISHRNQFELVEGYQPTHALFYLKKGSFVIELNGAREELGVGDCMILPNYIPFRRSVLNPIEFVYVKFARDTDCQYHFDIPYGRITFKDKSRFSSSIAALERSVALDGQAAARYGAHLLNDILLQIYFEENTSHEPMRERYEDRLVGEAVGYIVENIDKKLLIEDVCRAIGTNPSTLNAKIQRELGTSCGRLIMSERMKKARRLLISSTYSISEIATRCGFENVYYFSNAFKKENGISPSDFLKKHHE